MRSITEVHLDDVVEILKKTPKIQFKDWRKAVFMHKHNDGGIDFDAKLLDVEDEEVGFEFIDNGLVKLADSRIIFLSKDNPKNFDVRTFFVQESPTKETPLGINYLWIKTLSFVKIPDKTTYSGADVTFNMTSAEKILGFEIPDTFMLDVLEISGGLIV